MKYGIILLLILSGIAQGADYQRAYYPSNYYTRTPYSAPGYQAPQYYQYPVYQQPAYAYQQPGYQNPAYQNQRYYNSSYPAAYAYPNYYYPPSSYQDAGSSSTSTALQPELNSNRRKVLKKTKLKAKAHRSNLTRKSPSKSSQKRQFLNTILPLVINANQKIQQDRKQLLHYLNQGDLNKNLTNNDQLWIKKLAKSYRISGDIINNIGLQNELLKRVNEIAPSMALAQAANESAWGTSRFSRQGNNLFGIWTYNPEIGIKPLKREPGKKHFVRKFKSFQESVTVYMHTLNTHAAYKKLREIRYKAVLEGRNPTGYELARGLEKYSAKGQKYIQMIQAMINKNDLENIALSDLALN